MLQYVMTFQDYTEYFKNNTKLEKDEEDIIILNIEKIKNKNDEAWEYSIKWECDDEEEYGKITGINTSSIFALKSCEWEDE